MEPLIPSTHRPMPVEVLEADIRRICGAFDLEPASKDGGAAGDVVLQQVGLFDTAVVALEVSAVQRSARSIRQDPGEHLFLLIQDEGSCHIEQGQLSATLTQGDMALVDSTLPSRFHYDGRRSNQISLHLPRAEMLHRFGRICTGGLAIDRDDPLWIAMRAVLAKLVREPGGANASLSEAFLNLIGAYLHERQRQETGHPRQTLLSRALAMIDRRRADPGFGPGELAGELNVSDRMLQRHFRPLGETPGHRLLNRRLELARERLLRRVVGPGQDGIAAIAFDFGFNDLSYFYREFRKKYGAPPGAFARCH